MSSLLYAIPLIALFGACRTDHSKTSSNKTVSFACDEDIGTIDPRKARNLITINACSLFFEGLFETASDGTIKPALVGEYSISPDQKIYTFTLRKAEWSDGLPITAHDVVASWQAALSSPVRSPNASMLFVIKNGRALFDGSVAKEALGASALNDHTLQVELEQPVPYFLKLLACHPFLPLPHVTQDSRELEWRSCAYSGPFVVASWKPSSELILRKNEHYWNRDRIQIDEVRFLVLDAGTALTMFETGELDWAGSPMATVPPDAIRALKASKKLHILNACGTQFIRANCTHGPLASKKLRQALAASIDRSNICEHIMQGGHEPSALLVPPHLGLCPGPECTQEPKQALEDAIKELSITKEELAKTLSLSFPAKERTQKIALVLQQNWKEKLGLEIRLEPCEGKIFFEKLSKNDYCMALGSWIADFADPINFLEVFRRKDNGTNNTGWENARYQELLLASDNAPNQAARAILLGEAQNILIDEAPIFPIFHFTYNFVCSDRVRGCSISPTGLITIKDATIEDPMP